MRVWHASYVLRARARLGGRARTRDRRGALLRVERTGGADGYADLHPWPELGDASIDRQLDALREGLPTPQGARSLRLAALDGEARDLGRSLFDGLEVPPSHLLFTDARQIDAGAIPEEFTHAKVKVGVDWPAEVEAIARVGGRIRWRLDANATLRVEEVAEGLRRLGSIVDFVEDPCPFAPDAWRRLRELAGVALDRETDALGAPDSWSHLVLKPARDDPEPLARLAEREGRRVVVTSYLDHPVGQCHAAAAAGRLAARHPATVDVCGLLSHEAYEPTEFGERIVTRGPRLRPGTDQGIGFGDLLERQDWRRLA